MARQRKSLEEQIDVLEVQIDKLQGKLDLLLKQRDELLAKKREEELGELYEFMKANDMSIQDLYQLLVSDEQVEQQETA